MYLFIYLFIYLFLFNIFIRREVSVVTILYALNLSGAWYYLTTTTRLVWSYAAHVETGSGEQFYRAYELDFRLKPKIAYLFKDVFGKTSEWCWNYFYFRSNFSCFFRLNQELRAAWQSNVNELAKNPPSSEA